jgi:hypothetical protein
MNVFWAGVGKFVKGFQGILAEKGLGLILSASIQN